MERHLAMFLATLWGSKMKKYLAILFVLVTYTSFGLTQHNNVMHRDLPIIDPLVFGAKADGTTDDTSALNAAIASASAQGGGTIVLTKGIYAITGSINVASGVNIIGQGKNSSMVRWKPAATSGVEQVMFLATGSTPITDAKYSDFSVIGNKVTRNTNNIYGFYFYGLDAYTSPHENITIERLRIGYLSVGIAVSNSVNLRVKDCDIVACFEDQPATLHGGRQCGYGIVTEGSSFARITGNTIGMVSGNTAEVVDRHGIYLSAWQGSSTRTSDFTTISDNSVYVVPDGAIDPYSACISIRNPNNVAITGNTLIGGKTAGMVWDQSMGLCDGGVITGNNFVNYVDRGLLFSGDPATSSANINEVMVSNNFFRSAAATTTAILNVTARRLSINNNHFQNTAAIATCPAVGIDVGYVGTSNAYIESVMLNNNTFYGYTRGCTISSCATFIDNRSNYTSMLTPSGGTTPSIYYFPNPTLVPYHHQWPVTSWSWDSVASSDVQIDGTHVYSSNFEDYVVGGLTASGTYWTWYSESGHYPHRGNTAQRPSAPWSGFLYNNTETSTQTRYLGTGSW